MPGLNWRRNAPEHATLNEKLSCASLLLRLLRSSCTRKPFLTVFRVFGTFFYEPRLFFEDLRLRQGIISRLWLEKVTFITQFQWFCLSCTQTDKQTDGESKEFFFILLFNDSPKDKEGKRSSCLINLGNQWIALIFIFTFRCIQRSIVWYKLRFALEWHEGKFVSFICPSC